MRTICVQIAYPSDIHVGWREGEIMTTIVFQALLSLWGLYNSNRVLVQDSVEHRSYMTRPAMFRIVGSTRASL